MNQKKNIFWTVWGIVYPLGIYYTVIIVSMYIAALIFGNTNEMYDARKIFGVVVTLPVLYFMFYQPDQKVYVSEKTQRFSKISLIGIPFAIAAAFFIGFGMNNLVCLSPLIHASAGYTQATEALYSSSIWLELLSSAIITPILEEMLYRGIIFRRLKRTMSTWIAVLVSAVIFGAMHFNLVQFVYATVLGIFLAILAEVSGKLYISIICHCTANAIAIVRTETGLFSQTLVKEVWAYILAAAAVMVGVLLMFWYYRIGVKYKELNQE